eukprot:gene53843-71950_t
MIKAITLVSACACVTSFSISHGRSTTGTKALKMGFETEIGAQAPLGLWDPLGLLKDANQARFQRLRYVEMKHGRISMLAILGHLVTSAGVRLPGDIAYGVPFSSVKSGLAAFGSIPAAGIAQIFLFIGLLELGFGARQTEIEEAQLKASKWDAATIKRKTAIELNNGR